MEIDPLPIPAREPMNCEGVAQIVRARADATMGGFEANGSVQLAERASRCRGGQPAPILPDEYPVVRRSFDAHKGSPSEEIPLELDDE
jgi:hypothetical protein